MRARRRWRRAVRTVRQIQLGLGFAALALLLEAYVGLEDKQILAVIAAVGIVGGFLPWDRFLFERMDTGLSVVGAIRSLFAVKVRYGSTEREEGEPEDWKTVWLRQGRRRELEFDWRDRFLVVEVAARYEVQFPEDREWTRLWSDGQTDKSEGRRVRRYQTTRKSDPSLQLLPDGRPRLQPSLVQVKVGRYRGFYSPEGKWKVGENTRS